MVRVNFLGFKDYEDGKIAGVNTTGENEIPLNIFIDNYDEVMYLSPQICYADVSGVDRGVDIYETKEDLPKSETSLAPCSLIPIGTFPENEDVENFEESPDVLFSGVVKDVDMNPSPGEDDPNYCLGIRTLEFEFDLYLRYEGKIEPGYYVQGVAWLYADLYPESDLHFSDNVLNL